MSEAKKCKDCGKMLPVTREYFGQFKNRKANGEVVIGFRNSCRTCMAANTARHSANNPDLVQERNRLRRERNLQGGGDYTVEDIEAIRRELADACRFCALPLNRQGEVEHLTPVARGGTSNPNNLTLACSRCNLAKGNKTLTEFNEWRKERGLSVRQISPKGEAPDFPVGLPGKGSKAERR
ncbi:HNH endonuclease [Cupriavidus oxalaticus]|uniref:HNH endonuclease n=1 Tax=Cupriavidus oxalaticus TaxID=96344 RepID=A0A4P7LQZ5_9BURK|nr:HNH endonuclease signature motif containing protein [Cupriavidus oxalaticus]QBY56073.1 HNH endonuclease [Cupriavidus oxalaticus]